ncbi:MAG: hypothetical protein LUD07_09015 [Clostridiales bacterium]|nr:hypothetical protein [Clostridiales bacterium]
MKTQTPAAVRGDRKRFAGGYVRYRMGEMGEERTGKESKDQKKCGSQDSSEITQIRHITYLKGNFGAEYADWGRIIPALQDSF